MHIISSLNGGIWIDSYGYHHHHTTLLYVYLFLGWAMGGVGLLAGFEGTLCIYSNGPNAM